MKKLPPTYNQALGGLKATKGNWNGKQILTWDSIPKCRPDECTAAEDCHLPKSNNPNHTRCAIMSNYLRGIYSVILHNYELSETDLLKVGLHLIPMYKNLCRLQIEEHGIRFITTVNKSGNRSVNPVYDAIRNYILAIDGLWSKMGFEKKYTGTSNKKGAPQAPNVDDLLNGDKDYYDGLSENEEETTD